MTRLRAVCVYCGSNPGIRPAYAQQAALLGARLAQQAIRVVYGGGNVGLMGVVADAAMEAGGEVIGVIPESLVGREVGHRGISRLEIVDSMHARKARMFDLSDAFVALPGGFGTLDEMFEMLTWRQLGLGDKPCAFLDVDGFYTPLFAMMDRMVADGFVQAGHLGDLWHGGQVDAMLAWMRAYEPLRAGEGSEKGSEKGSDQESVMGSPDCASLDYARRQALR